MPLRLVLKTDGSSRTFPLEEGEILLGSGDGCDLRLADPTISRRHARIRVERQWVEVEDLGSTNGTRVRGRTIDGPVRVEAGDAVAFGTVEGRLERVGEDDLQAAVTFEAADGDGPEAPGGGESRRLALSAPHRTTRTTASIGSLQRFPLDHLPAWLRCLEDRVPLAEAVQTVGAGLFEVLPCRRVRVTAGRTEGVLFEAEREEGGRSTGPQGTKTEGAAVSIPGRAATVEAELLSASQAAAYRVLVEAAARLLALVAHREPVRSRAERDRLSG
ncbi:MAG: FHA domain-containing protein, partial [Acidobacteriota bacterium]